MAKRNITMAICYDFDGTLSPGNMQEYEFIPLLNIKNSEFWKEVKQRSKQEEADNIIAYMCLMIEKAIASNEVRLSRDAFQKYGKTIDLYGGVGEWFDRINQFGKDLGVVIEHYIISSGLREMIEGTSIARQFKRIYASSFMYDQHKVAKWPGMAINYTTKTQFLFRINKGALDVWDNSRINTYVTKQERPIPFNRMIYIGDGSTDVPCMKLVKAQGGHSIAVYKPNSSPKRKEASQLLREDRVNFVAPADYHDGKQLDGIIKAVIQKIAAQTIVEKLEKSAMITAIPRRGVPKRLSAEQENGS